MQHNVWIWLASLLLAHFALAEEVKRPLQNHGGNRMAVQVSDLKELRDTFKLTNYGSQNYSRLKIAVLDKGFAGVYPARSDGRLWLPADTEVVDSYPGVKTASPLDPKDFHGTHMAHLIWAMTNYASTGPKFRLYNASSPENFVAATEDLIAWGADIVLFSQNWPGFGNFDGSGFLNEALREVTDHRILWFNAAGNYGGKVYNGPVKLIKSGENWWLDVHPKRTDSTRYFLKFVNEVDENQVTIALAWNSVFPGWVKKGTEKDLDFSLYAGDENGKLINEPIKSSKLRQKLEPVDEKDTLFPLEQMKVTLPKGTFYIAVECTSDPKAFSETEDKIRVSIMGAKQPFWDSKTEKLKSSVTFTDATNDGEIMTPADGPGLTVGDLTADSAKGPTVDGRGKPELIVEKNNVTFTDKNGYYGTSYAAAYMAGVAAVLKTAQPSLSQKDLLAFRQHYPLEQWSKDGWASLKDSLHSYSLKHEFSAWAEEKFGKEHVFVRGTYSDPIVGVVGDIKKHFSNSGPSDWSDHLVYVRTQVQPTKKRELVPASTEWKWVTLREGFYKTEWTTERKSRRVMTHRGQYYWDYKTDAQRIEANVVDIYGRKVGSLNLGTLYTQTPVKKYQEPKYETQYYDQPVPKKVWVPAKRDYRKVTTPAHYRTVDGEPRITHTLVWHHQNIRQAPWQRYVGSQREDFTRVVELESPFALGDGLVVDGSRSEPRIWSTPTPYELRVQVR